MMTAVLIAACFLTAFVCAGAVARLGPSLGLMDRPGRRSSHTRPVPKGGGVGILAAFLLAAAASGWWLFAVAGALLSLVSLIGDRRHIPQVVRLAVQAFAALLALLWAGDLLQAPLPGTALFFLFALVFITGTANFYNFMDGINGIAGITGIVGFALLAIHLDGDRADQARMAWCLCAACAGFLPWNLPRARVFMGDVGSVLLGFAFAVLVVAAAEGPAEFLTLALLLFPFYADELTTMCVRLRKGENLLEAHRGHLYQILVNEGGIPHWRVAVGYGLTQVAVGAAAVSLQGLGSWGVAGLGFAGLLAFGLLRRLVAFRLGLPR